MWTHWKSFTSIAVKWRQAAEPLDSVFWIDKAIDRSTPNKMCLYTHLWNRFNEPQRYVTYFNKAFELVKELVKTRGLWIPMDKFPSWLHGVWVNTTAGDAFETETSEPIVTLAQLATGLNTTIDALHSGIDRATTLFELYGVLGKIDAFSTYTWIESRIHSDATTMDHWLPGSRLTVTRSTQSLGSNTTYAEDMEIYICSPSHDDRVQRFSREIERQFEVLTDTLLAIEITQQSCLSRLGKHPKHYRKHTLRRSVVREVCGGEMDSVQLLRQQAVHQALHMLYYWVVLAPLTRGSSFTGYAVLLSTLLYLGEMPQVSWPRPFNPNDPAASKRLYFLPHNKQLDWEALLTPSPHEFVDNVLGKMIRWNSSHGFHENVTATTVVLPHIHGLYTVRERASLKRWTSALRGIKRTKKHRDISFYRSTLKNACVDPTAHACLWRKVPSRKDMNEALFGGPIVFDV